MNDVLGPESKTAGTITRPGLRTAHVIIVAYMLVLTACAGGAGISDDGSGTTSGGDQVTSTVGGDESSETTTSSVSDGEEEPPAEPGEGAGQDTDFCVWIRANAADDTDFADPVATEESMTRNLAEAADLRSNVPQEAAADFEVVYQLMVDTEAIFAANGYNLFGIPDGVLEGVTTDEVIEASSNISDYCGAGL